MYIALSRFILHTASSISSSLSGTLQKTPMSSLSSSVGCLELSIFLHLLITMRLSHVLKYALFFKLSIERYAASAASCSASLASSVLCRYDRAMRKSDFSYYIYSCSKKVRKFCPPFVFYKALHLLDSFNPEKVNKA